MPPDDVGFPHAWVAAVRGFARGTAGAAGRSGRAQGELPPHRPAVPPYRRRLTAVCTLIFISAMLGAMPAFLLREVLDVAIPRGERRPADGARRRDGRDPDRDRRARRLADAALEPGRAERDARPAHAVYRHLQRLSLAFFTRTRTGEVQSRIANDIGGIDNVVTSTATSVLSNVTTVLATVVAMLLLDWRLAAFALALLPLFVWLTKRVGEQRKKVVAERQASLADVSSIVQESLSVSGILLGKTMGRTGDLAERFRGESARLAEPRGAQSR